MLTGAEVRWLTLHCSRASKKHGNYSWPANFADISILLIIWEFSTPSKTRSDTFESVGCEQTAGWPSQSFGWVILFSNRPQINAFWKSPVKDMWGARGHGRGLISSCLIDGPWAQWQAFPKSLNFRANRPQQRGGCRAEWIMKNTIKTKSDRDLNYMQGKYFWGKWDGREGLGRTEELITRATHSLYHLILENFKPLWEGGKTATGSFLWNLKSTVSWDCLVPPLSTFPRPYPVWKDSDLNGAICKDSVKMPPDLKARRTSELCRCIFLATCTCHSWMWAVSPAIAPLL